MRSRRINCSNDDNRVHRNGRPVVSGLAIALVGVASVLLVGGAVGGCKASRVRQPSIEDWETMAFNSTTELLEKERRTRGDAGGAYGVWVAVLPVQYRGSVAGGANDAAVYASISKAVTDSQLFQPVSRDLVIYGIREANIGEARRLLALRKPREQFMSVLTDNGIIPEYFILPELATLETKDENGKVIARKTTIYLQLARSDNGAVAQEASGEAMQTL